MNGGIVNEFSHGKELQPFLGLAFIQDAEIHFKFLVIVFHFSIGLWVVG